MQILRELFGLHFGQQTAELRETGYGSDFKWNRCTVWKTLHSSLSYLGLGRRVRVCVFML